MNENERKYFNKYNSEFYGYDVEDIDINEDDSYCDVLQKLQLQCKQRIREYQEEHNLKTDYQHLFSNSYISNIIKDEDDIFNHLKMNNEEEAKVFFEYLQSLLNRNFIENRKYELFDDCGEIEYNNQALYSAQHCENDKNYDFKDENENKVNEEIEIKKKKIKKKTTTFKKRNDPPKDIIQKNINNYLKEKEEKKKNEERNSFQFIAKPCPKDILKPKYDSIVEQSKLRHKENVNMKLNMWKSILKPFSFDERDLKKQQEKMEKEKEKNNEKNKKIKNNIVFKLVQTAAEDGYNRYKKMKEIDKYAHLTPEHKFHPNISKDIPSIYKINSKKYKELKEKKLIEKYKEEKKEMERKAKHEKLILQKVRMQPTNTYKDTRSSILRNKSIIEKDESEKLYKEIEKELWQDKERDQLKIKNYVHDKLKDLYFRKYFYEKEIKEKGIQNRKEQEILDKKYEEKIKNIYEDINNNRNYLFETPYIPKKSKPEKEINPLERFNDIIKTNGLNIDDFNVYI
ncbi:hypothetical protein BCR32DRAFT_295574 [Anaeromyces robustus]|uniref:Uncharacterized protein n=1 Tax=Anaeromyces robustus TaxID=1754192 RepID=A0A1Y1WVF5_9FUNG|nr:hypothetical protein BCR32DRAFT_295574 [Anaeromyces robustus]|eukprot:ORX77493.1 hypothetical protein BCR32DRAFT_295574 [Anaeromyces robustus]